MKHMPRFDAKWQYYSKFLTITPTFFLCKDIVLVQLPNQNLLNRGIPYFYIASYVWSLVF